MKDYPLVSIITPSYNGEQYIEDTILSVSGQDYPAIEYIIIDGGSTDNTLSIIEKYKSKIAVFVSEEDDGTSEAINKGFKMAKGEFVWIINANDMLVRPNAISVLSSYLINNPDCSFVFGNMFMINESGQIIGQRKFKNYDLVQLLIDRRYLPFAGCLMRKSVLNEIGYFDTALKFGNDLDFYLRLVTFKKFAHVNAFTGIFRLHSLSSNNIYAAGLEATKICLNYLEKYHDSGKLNVSVNRIRGAIFQYAASCCFHSARSDKVRKNVLKSISHWPRTIANPKVWVYFLVSLLGDKCMDLTAQLFRNLIHRKIGYHLNNLWY